MSDIEEMAKEISLALRLGDHTATAAIMTQLISHARSLGMDDLDVLADQLEQQLGNNDLAAANAIASSMGATAGRIDARRGQPFGPGFHHGRSLVFDAVGYAGLWDA